MPYVLLFWYCLGQSCAVGSADYNSQANCDAAAKAWQGNAAWQTVGGICTPQ